MPDHRRHRGAHPQDNQLFAASQLSALRRAVNELSWLLSHGYAVNSSLKLVGDRHALTERQRLAVVRAACSDRQQVYRRQTHCERVALKGQRVVLDGFNLIITMEAAVSGGVLLQCRDGCIRDLSSVHGSYRSVSETDRAICLIGDLLWRCEPASALWLLDQPVSNSGRLAQRIRELAAEHAWPWEVEVVMNPDRMIKDARCIALTSDSNVLDHVSQWFNLHQEMLESVSEAVWLLDLQDEAAD